MKKNFIEILGIRISTLTFDQILEKITMWIESSDSATEGPRSQVIKKLARGKDKGQQKQYYIVTVNPEFVVRAQDDVEFKRILNEADLGIADGISIIWASKIGRIRPIGPIGQKGQGQILTRITGVDLMERLCKLAAKRGWKVALLGGGEGVAVKAGECLRKRYPGLRIKAIEVGEVGEEGKLISSIRPIRPIRPIRRIRGIDLLFVGLGMGKQERFIRREIGCGQWAVGKEMWKRGKRVKRGLILRWGWEWAELWIILAVG